MTVRTIPDSPALPPARHPCNQCAAVGVHSRQPEITVPGVKAYELPIIAEQRGNLSFAELGQSLPFLVKRFFIISNVPDGGIRGGHAHKQLHEYLVCVQGSCVVVVDDGEHRHEISFVSAAVGLYVPPMIWAMQYGFSRDALLLGLASDIYDPSDYIRDYDEFLKLKKL